MKIYLFTYSLLMTSTGSFMPNELRITLTMVMSVMVMVMMLLMMLAAFIWCGLLMFNDATTKNKIPTKI